MGDNLTIKIKELNLAQHQYGNLFVSDSKLFYGSRIATAQIDEEDFEWAKKYGWYISYKGYVFTRIDNRTMFYHRMAMNISDPNVTVDHNDSDKLNNKKSNLILMSSEKNTLKSWHEQGTHDLLLKPVCMIDRNTDKVLMKFESVKKAAKYLYEHKYSNKVNQGAISNACCGRAKTACGYKWRWSE